MSKVKKKIQSTSKGTKGRAAAASSAATKKKLDPDQIAKRNEKIIHYHKIGWSAKRIGSKVNLHHGNVMKILAKWRAGADIEQVEHVEIEPAATATVARQPASPPANVPVEPTTLGGTDGPGGESATPSVATGNTSSTPTIPLLIPLSLIDAAAINLLRNDRNSMRPNDMVDAVIKFGLWQQRAGKTPGATLWKSILAEIKRKGDSSRFAWTESGHYGLTQTGMEWAKAKVAELGLQREVYCGGQVA